MTEALNLGGPANLDRIHLDDPREVAYWTHVLATSEEELIRVVAMVGPRAADVRHEVSRSRHAEHRRKTHWSPSHIQIERDLKERHTDAGLVVVISFALAVAMSFGALAYKAAPAYEWTTFKRHQSCEAATNGSSDAKSARCADGRTLVGTELATAADGKPTRPKR